MDNTPTNIERAEALANSVDFQHAMELFKGRKPFKGAFTERVQKFIELNDMLCHITKLNVIISLNMPTLTPEIADQMGLRGRSEVIVQRASVNGKEIYLIMLMAKLSVLTFLNGWGYVLGLEPVLAKAWSKAVFSRFFPDD